MLQMSENGMEQAVLLPLTAFDRGIGAEERIAMSKQTNAISIRTIGIDTAKNTLHLIGPDQITAPLPRVRQSGIG